MSETDIVLLVGGVVFAILGGMLGWVVALLLRRSVPLQNGLGFQLLVSVVVVSATYIVMIMIASFAFEDGSFGAEDVFAALRNMQWQGYVLFAIEALAAILVARRLVRPKAKVDPAVFD